MNERYSMAAVARRTGLYPDTIRAWERRYGLIKPRRESSGVRAYAESDIVRLELARDVTRLGHAIRYVATLPNSDLRRLVGATKPESSAYDDSAAAVVSRTLEALQIYDFRLSQQSLTAAAVMLPREDFALRVVAPLLRRVGADWSEGKLDIAQEHAVSQLVRNLISSLTLQAPESEGTFTMVFATPPGELHEFGIALGALIAAGSGIATHVLGPNLPAIELARAASQMHARTVVVGSLRAGDNLAVSAFLRSLRDAVPARTDLWVGGPDAVAICKKAGARKLRAFPTLELFAEGLRAVRGKAAS